jgi:predicted transcriptional regulator
MTPAGAVLSYLAAINLVLGAFNLVPAFPLDGGRVFRSIVWALTHRFERATSIAATVGQGFGFLMIALGVARVIFGDFLGGLWTIFVGWFLTQAAGAANQDRAMRESLRGVAVGDLMDRSIPIVEPRMSLQQLVFEHLLRSERRRLIVVQDGVPVGIVNARGVNSVPRDLWATTPVERIMLPIPFSVSAQTPAVDVVGQLSERSTLVPVVNDGRVVGAVDLMRILRFAQLRQELRVHIGPSSMRPSAA